jgi:tRNA dimethylallyltransferase
MNVRKALCLLGPTGAGKTEAALALAEAFDGAVVNFDSRQVYRDVPITTAQPSPEEQARCPHLLYGFLPCMETISAGIYAETAASAVRELLATGITPILVGGTGLYLRALLEGLAPIPEVPPQIRDKVLAEWDLIGGDAMHERLRLTDPAYAAKVHPNDRLRVTRALEVHEATGRTFTKWHNAAVKALDIPCLKMGISMDKDSLDRRLKARIEVMLHAGALEEVRLAMRTCPDPGAPGLSGIGCAELAAHLLGGIDFDEARALWLSNTKAYAKRQMTWFKKEPGVHWFGPGEAAALVELAGKFLLEPT